MALLSRERYSEVDIIVCDATPEGDIAAPVGSMALSTEGVLYTKASGTGNTGWKDESEILTGNTLWVDAVNGDDATGLPGRQDRPYATPEAAVAEAVTGDLVDVRPGTYALTGNLAKDGVNWNWQAGAIGSMITDSEMSIFDDGDDPLTMTLTGAGVFVRGEVSEPTGFANVVHMTNPDSSFVITCGALENTCFQESPETGGTAAIYHANGSLTVNCDTIEAQATAYYWIAGPAWINADTIRSNGNADNSGDGVLCMPPEGNSDNVFIRAHSIISAYKSAVYSSLTQSIAPNFRLWITAEVIAGGTYGVQHASGKMYVTAQKISASSNGGTAVGNVGPASTELYVTSQKIASADSLTESTDFILVFASGGKVRISCMEWDVSSISAWTGTVNLFTVTSTDPINFVCTGGKIVLPAAITTPIIGNSPSFSGGRRVFRDMHLDNSAAGGAASSPIVISDGLTVIQGVTIVTAAAASIGADSAMDITSYNSYANTLADIVNVTVQGDLTVGAYVQ